MVESSPKEKKTLWEKEEMLIVSNFSFSHIVLKRLVLHTHEKKGIGWERVSDPLERCLLKIVKKGENTVNPFPNDKFNPLPDEKIFRLVQVETNCRRHFKVHLK